MCVDITFSPKPHTNQSCLFTESLSESIIRAVVHEYSLIQEWELHYKPSQLHYSLTKQVQEIIYVCCCTGGNSRAQEIVFIRTIHCGIHKVLNNVSQSFLAIITVSVRWQAMHVPSVPSSNPIRHRIKEKQMVSQEPYVVSNIYPFHMLLPKLGLLY